MAAGIAGLGFQHAAHLLEGAFDAPEAAAGQGNLLSHSGHAPLK